MVAQAPIDPSDLDADVIGSHMGPKGADNPEWNSGENMRGYTTRRASQYQ
jgi:hypothetical protein